MGWGEQGGHTLHSTRNVSEMMRKGEIPEKD